MTEGREGEGGDVREGRLVWGCEGGKVSVGM